MTYFKNETRFKDRLKPIKFEERLKDHIDKSKREIGVDFPFTRTLIQKHKGVGAAKTFLSMKNVFSEGFKRAMERGGSSYTLEAAVLEYKDSGLFTDTEIEIAQWRLANYEKVEG